MRLFVPPRLPVHPLRLAAVLSASLCLAPLALAEPVHIPGPEGRLEAEMFAVEGATHTVVIIPGSGPIDRDGNIPEGGMASNTYRLLAEALAERGIASLRIDKRGFFGSETAIADPNEVTIAAYAEDARSWVERAAYLSPCVWIAGHSEGGLVALVAGQDAPEPLCGLILMATPGRPIGRLLVEQLAAQPEYSAFTGEIEAIVAGLERGEVRDPEAISPELHPLFGAGLQRYMVDLFAYDPAAIAQDWQGPALIVQGDADIQIRTLDADLLEAALPAAERIDLDGATHMLKPDIPGRPLATYTDPSHPLHPDLVPAIADFLDRHPVP